MNLFFKIHHVFLYFNQINLLAILFIENVHINTNNFHLYTINVHIYSFINNEVHFKSSS